VTKNSKESWPIADLVLVCGEKPGFGLPPGRGLSMTLLSSKYLWSTPSLLETVTGRVDYL